MFLRKGLAKGERVGWERFRWSYVGDVERRELELGVGSRNSCAWAFSNNFIKLDCWLRTGGEITGQVTHQNLANNATGGNVVSECQLWLTDFEDLVWKEAEH